MFVAFFRPVIVRICERRFYIRTMLIIHLPFPAVKMRSIQDIPLLFLHIYQRLSRKNPCYREENRI